MCIFLSPYFMGLSVFTLKEFILRTFVLLHFSPTSSPNGGGSVSLRWFTNRHETPKKEDKPHKQEIKGY